MEEISEEHFPIKIEGLYSAKDNHFQLAELRTQNVLPIPGRARKQLLTEMILAEYRPVRVQCLQRHF